MYIKLHVEWLVIWISFSYTHQSVLIENFSQKASYELNSQPHVVFTFVLAHTFFQIFSKSSKCFYKLFLKVLKNFNNQQVDNCIKLIFFLSLSGTFRNSCIWPGTKRALKKKAIRDIRRAKTNESFQMIRILSVEILRNFIWSR